MYKLLLVPVLLGFSYFSTAQVSPPYFQNFDGVTAPALPSGWSEIDNGNDDLFSVTSTDHGEPIPSSPNAIELNDGDITSGDTAMLISPQLMGLSTGSYRIRFKASLETGGTSEYLIIGTLSDPANGSTFVPYDTIQHADLTNSFSEYIIIMNDLAKIGNREYVGIAHGEDIFEIYIDDFYFEALPSCVQPSGLAANNVTATSAEISWSSGGASNWQIEYGPQGYTPGSGTLITPITTNPYTLTALSSSTQYDVYVRDSCGPGDVSLWSGPVSFTTSIQNVNCSLGGSPTVVFSEEFDGSSVFSGDFASGTSSFGWFYDINSTTSGSTGPDAPHSGTHYIYTETSGGSNGDTAAIVSSAIDLSAGIGFAQLTFWLHAYGATIGELNINVSSSPSGPFATVYNRPAGATQTSSGDPFTQVGVNLDAYVGQIIYIELEYIRGSSFTGDLAIDLMEITSCVSCSPPSNLMTSNLTPTTAEISWTTGGASDWQIEYGPEGFLPGSGTLISPVSTNPYTITGLTEASIYDVYVRDSCGVGDVSFWVGPVNFTTPCSVVLSGVYSINGAVATGGTNFNSFADAGAALSLCGISGPVTFNVQPGTYVDHLHIFGIPGMSAANTVTFNGSGADTLIWDQTGPQAAVLLDSAIYVTLNGLNIVNQIPTTEAWGVLLTNGSDNVSIDGCYIEMNTTSSSSDVAAILISESYDSDLDEGGEVDNLIIQNCTLVGGYYGINLEGNGTGFPSFGNRILNNLILDWYQAGMYLDEMEDIEIMDNTIISDRNSGGDGIYTFDMNDYRVERNTVEVEDYGIYITDGNDGFTPGSRSRVVNNMVISTGDYGLYLNDFEATDVFHNSSLGEPAIRINDQIDADIRNNIFVSVADFAFESDDALTGTDVVDYNIYNSGSATVFDISTSTYADLAAWVAAEPAYNANSLEGDPLFVGPDDLHVIGTLADGVADPIVSVPTDIDGDTRSLTTPDIGADEYSPASCLPSTNLQASNITGTSADLNWVPGNGTNFNIEYGPSGFTPGTGTLITGVSSPPYTLSGLNSSTSYEWYVQDDCGSGQVSMFAGPGSFTTLVQPVTCANGSPATIFTEEFDGTSAFTGDFASSTSDFGWFYDANTTTSSSTGPSGPHSGTEYIYTETSGGSAGDTAEIVSSLIDLSAASGEAQLTFWLHAYGDDIGELNINVGNSPTGPFSNVYNRAAGQLQTSSSEPYQQIAVNLDAFLGQTIYIQLQYLHGGSFNGDLAIDLMELETCFLSFCAPPSNLSVSAVTSGSASLQWTTGGASDWQIEYGPTGFTPGTGNLITPVSTNPFTITGLSPQTSYDAYVRDSCGAGSVSNWVGPVSFTTLCAPYTAPYSENFDTVSTPALPACWSEISSSASSVQTVSSTDHSVPIPSLPNAVEFNDATYAMLISPEFSDLPSGTNQVRLQVAYEGAQSGFSDTLFFGVMSGPLDTASFVPLDTILLGNTNGTFNQYLFLLDNTSLIGSHTFVALSYANAGGNYEFYVDNFIYEAIPACNIPTALGVANVTATTAEIFWTSGGATNWNVEYGPAGFTPGTGTLVSATNDTTTLIGLMSATTYEFYVRDSCGVGSVSLWSGPYAFTTSCAPDIAPYTQSFDVAGIPNCWQEYAGSGGPWEFDTDFNSVQCPAATDHTGNGGEYIWVDQSSSDDSVVLEMNEVDISALVTPYLEFYYWMCGVGYSPVNLLLVEAWNGSSWILVDTIQQGTTGWELFEYDLSGYVYSGNLVKIRFRAESGGSGDDFYGDQALDDISIIEAPAPPCPPVPPTGTTTANICQGDSIFLAGAYQTTAGVYFDTLSTSAGCDSLLSTTLNVDPTYNIGVSESICAGDSIFLAGAYQSMTGIYIDSLTTAAGCDSVVATTLSVIPLATTNVPVSICQGDSIFLAGAYRSTPGVYTAVFAGPNGCDSTVNNILTVNPSYSISALAAICQGDSIFLAGAYQTLAGVYSDSLTTAAGCDSVITTSLTVNPSYSISATAEICMGDSILLGGAYQTAAGVYTDVYTTADGCDSLVSTSLTVNPNYLISASASICSGDSLFLGGAYQTTAGVYTDSLSSVNGCDSVITTTLAVGSSKLVVNNLSICQGDSVLVNGMYVSMAGVFNDTLSTPSGCDSIYSTVVSIRPVFNVNANLSICQGDSVFLGGAFQTVGGVYLDTLAASNGCDSIVNSTLTVLLPVFTTAPIVEICQGDSALAGGAYRTMAGVYYDTLTAANGCDSVIGTQIIVNPTYTINASASICQGDSILLGGAYRTVAGVYSDVYLTTAGCDSVINTSLSVAPSSITTATASICSGDSILLGGAYRTTAGVYTDTLTSTNGCDSVVLTTLAVGSSKIVVNNLSICQGESVLIAGMYVTMGGVYNDTLTTPSGCDSIYSVVLTVNPSYMSSLPHTICEGDSILLAGAFRTTAGSYIDSLTASNGCDSVVNNMLTVLPEPLVVVTASICPDDSILIGGIYRSLPGTYDQPFLAANGCDSIYRTIVTYKLTGCDSLPPSVGDSLLIVSDTSWRQSTVVDLSNANYANWPGVSGSLPASGTFVLPVVIGNRVDTVDSAYAINSGTGIRFFRKTFQLTVDTGVVARIRAFMDDGMEVYVNGHLLAREKDRSTKNWKGNNHDVIFFANGTSANGYLGGDRFDYVTALRLDSLVHQGENEIVVALQNKAVWDNGGFSFRMDLQTGVPVIPLLTSSIVSDINWRQSTVVTPTPNWVANWKGVDSLPPDSSFNLEVDLEPLDDGKGIFEVPGSQPILSGDNITYYRTSFELMDSANINMRIRSTFDEMIEIYVNRKKLVRTTDLSSSNRRLPAHDILYPHNMPYLNGYSGGEMYDHVEMINNDSLFRKGINSIIVVLRNRPASKGGFSFRMDLDQNGNPVIVQKRETIYGEEGTVRDLEVLAYPNPTTSSLTVEVPATENAAEVLLRDLTGKMLLQHRLTGSTTPQLHEISLSHLPKGAYLLQWTIGDEYGSLRIIKQ